jgi:hypothetical protein
MSTYALVALRIAEALNVTAMTISNDLDGFKPTLKPSRPKGGRPKGSGKPHKSTQPPLLLMPVGLQSARIAKLLKVGLADG